MLEAKCQEYMNQLERSAANFEGNNVYFRK